MVTETMAATKNRGEMTNADRALMERIVNILAREKDITYEERLRILELLRTEWINPQGGTGVADVVE